jgi:hypothetical protein
MGVGTSIKSLFERLGVEILGWTLIPLGIVLMPLPGPGMLIVVAGVGLLSRRHVWAQKMLDPLRRKAVDAAKYGVATWPRILLSFLGGVWLVALGVVWWVSPEIPEFDLFDVSIGPDLPGAGVVAALVLWVAAAAVWLQAAVRSDRVGPLRLTAISVLVVLGLIWWIGPDIPEYDRTIGFGPQLPAHGWGTAIGLWASAIAAWALLAYSVVRWREPRHEPRPETHSNA